MEVKLIAYTQLCPDLEEENIIIGPDNICDLAARTCVSEDMPDLFINDGEGRIIRADAECKSLKRATASNHLSVVEHCNLTYSVSGVSRALLAQLSRHRLISMSVQSQRYVCMDNFDYFVPDSIRANEDADNDFYHLMNILRDCYENFASEEGYAIPIEDARAILPNACKTNLVLTVNARELLHMASLRMCVRAQEEIREMVTRMVAQAKQVAPIIFRNAGAFCEQYHYCPEQKGCGKYPKMNELFVRVKLDDSVPDCKTCKKGFVKWEAPEDD